MPVSVVVELPPVDSPFLSEETLAEVVLGEFFAARRSGISWELPCSVASVRLQQLIRQRYPRAYERLIEKGRWEGKWHRFVQAIAGLRCFTYSLSDYAHAVDLGAHTAPGELRCCRAGENFFVVWQADCALGALLQEHVLREEAMGSWCALVANAALAGSRSNCNRTGQSDPRHRCSCYGRRCNAASATRPLWLAPHTSPLVATLVKRLAATAGSSGGRGGGGGLTDSLRHGAANKIASLLVEENALARHVSLSQLRRHVLRCVSAWEQEQERRWLRG